MPSRPRAVGALQFVQTIESYHEAPVYDSKGRPDPNGPLARQTHGEAVDGFLLCTGRVDGEVTPDSRWWPQPSRIRRPRLVVGPAGLDDSLLPLQQATTSKGTQLHAECPRLRTGSGQPHGRHQRQTDRDGTDGKNHRCVFRPTFLAESRMLPRRITTPNPRGKWPRKSASYPPVPSYARWFCEVKKRSKRILATDATPPPKSHAMRRLRLEKKRLATATPRGGKVSAMPTAVRHARDNESRNHAAFGP